MAIIQKHNPYLTTAQAAEILGMTIFGVVGLVRRGVLPVMVHHRVWLLDPDDVEAAKGRPDGRLRRMSHEAVRDIRRRRAKGESLEAIAADYGTDGSNISLIARRKRYAHVD